MTSMFNSVADEGDFSGTWDGAERGDADKIWMKMVERKMMLMMTLIMMMMMTMVWWPGVGNLQHFSRGRRGLEADIRGEAFFYGNTWPGNSWTRQ